MLHQLFQLKCHPNQTHTYIYTYTGIFSESSPGTTCGLFGWLLIAEGMALKLEYLFKNQKYQIPALG